MNSVYVGSFLRLLARQSLLTLRILLMQPKLIVTFDRLNNAEFVTKSGTIVAGLTENANYPEPWMPQLSTLVELTIAQTDFQTAYHEALSMDRLKIAHREDCRFILTGMLRKLAPYIEIVAQGNVSVLETSGYDLRHDTAHLNIFEPLPAPIDFIVSHGAFSGTIDVKVTRLDGVSNYEAQITQLDPMVELNWVHALWSTSATHMLISNLIPGQIYWVRVRGLGAHGVGLWTDPHNIMVI
jgi:hypothetical protein